MSPCSLKNVESRDKIGRKTFSLLCSLTFTVNFPFSKAFLCIALFTIPFLTGCTCLSSGTIGSTHDRLASSIEILPENRYRHYRKLYYDLNFEKVVGETVQHYQREIDKRFESATLRNIESSKLSDKEFKQLYRITRDRANRMVNGMQFSLQEYLKLKSHIEKYALYNKGGNLGASEKGNKIKLDDMHPKNWLKTFPKISILFPHSKNGINRYRREVKNSNFNYPYVGIMRDFSPFNEYNDRSDEKSNIPYQTELFIRKEGYNSDHGFYKLQQKRILIGEGEKDYLKSVKQLRDWSLLNYPMKTDSLSSSISIDKETGITRDQFTEETNRKGKLNWVNFVDSKIHNNDHFMKKFISKNNNIMDESDDKIVLSRITCLGGLIHTLNPLRRITDEEKVFRKKRVHTIIISTLQGHLLAGEERFCVIHDKKDNKVYFDMASFSKPNGLWGNLARPYIRILQKSFFNNMESDLSKN